MVFALDLEQGQQSNVSSTSRRPPAVAECGRDLLLVFSALMGVYAGELRRTIPLALRLNGAPGLERTDDDRLDTPVETFRFPGDRRALAADPRWSGTLDTLRERGERGEELSQ
jgi:hypothetical protein